MGTVPSVYSPVAGDDATQGRVLTWADALNFLLGSTTSGGSRRAVCVLQQGVAQSLPNSTSTAITFDSETVDYDNGHSTVTATDTYTVQTTGWYLISGTAAFASNATGVRQAWIAKNGTAIPGAFAQNNAAAATPTPVPVAATIEFFNAGDTIKLFGWQNSTGALLTSVASDVRSRLVVEWRSN